jgi:hypothetical protein
MTRRPAGNSSGVFNLKPSFYYVVQLADITGTAEKCRSRRWLPVRSHGVRWQLEIRVWLPSPSLRLSTLTTASVTVTGSGTPSESA